MAFKITINTEDAGPSENLRKHPTGSSSRQQRRRTAFGSEHTMLKDAYVKINRFEVVYAPLMLLKFDQEAPVVLVTLGVYTSAEERQRTPRPVDVINVAIPDMAVSMLLTASDPRAALYDVLPTYDDRLKDAVEV